MGCSGGRSPNNPDFDALWDYGDPVATEAQFRALLADETRELSRDTQIQIITQIARTLGLQQKYDQAHALLDSIEPEVSLEPTLPQVRYQLERGRVYNSSQDKESALGYFRDALGNALLIGADYFAVDAAHMLAIASPPNQALDWNLRALALAETSDDPRTETWVGSLYNNIGWTYHDQEKYRKALEMFELALDYRQKQGDVEAIRIARWCIARTYRSLNIYDEALKIQRELAAQQVDQKLEPDGYISEEIGECLLALGQPEAAKPHFRTAAQLLSQDIWLVQNVPERLERLELLGQ